MAKFENSKSNSLRRESLADLGQGFTAVYSGLTESDEHTSPRMRVMAVGSKDGESILKLDNRSRSAAALNILSEKVAELPGRLGAQLRSIRQRISSNSVPETLEQMERCDVAEVQLLAELAKDSETPLAIINDLYELLEEKL